MPQQHWLPANMARWDTAAPLDAQAAVAAADSSEQQQAAATAAAVRRNGSEKSSSKDSSSSSSKDSSSAAASAVATDEVAVQSHPLPAYPIDDEERDSFDKAQQVIARLQGRGYKALIVGGWVRDKYLGRRASDIDIATNATPWQLKALFRDVVLLPRSTVKLSHAGEVLEVTCFRGISRAASLFSVASDAARRDFTINALYFDPSSGTVLDFVGGVADAQQRVLRLTGDSAALLAEDPLRLLRCVRLVATLGLRLAPATAAAVKAHAHLCSVQQGLPPRRIWLELRKLHRAELQQPGTWVRSLKLAYHLGLLQHLFPWLQQQQLHCSPLAAAQVQQQAVQVAERLGVAWKGKGVPLVLLVAATLHPMSVDRQQALQQFEQYFQEPSEIAAVRALLDAAVLTHASSSSSSASLQPGSSSSSSSADDEVWVRFYAGEHAAACLDILAAWMPGAFAASFRQLHQGRMMQLRSRIEQHRQLQHAQQEQQQRDRHSTAAPAASQQQQQQQQPSSASEALQQRRRRQREELSAAIQALVGEQQGQQQLPDEGEEGIAQQGVAAEHADELPMSSTAAADVVSV
ncbi:hypothetical protein OEZ86_006698 [Tetradesmus obliquus]|nr:hypothetical protein OEZ86_006698 [Tetradesmus obliquus]